MTVRTAQETKQTTTTAVESEIAEAVDSRKNRAYNNTPDVVITDRFDSAGFNCRISWTEMIPLRCSRPALSKIHDKLLENGLLATSRFHYTLYDSEDNKITSSTYLNYLLVQSQERIIKWAVQLDDL